MKLLSHTCSTPSLHTVPSVSQKHDWQSPCQSFGVKRITVLNLLVFVWQWHIGGVREKSWGWWVTSDWRRSVATALLAAWGNSELPVGLLSAVKSYLFAGGLLKGTNLAHGYSRSHFHCLCTDVKYKVSKSTERLSFSAHFRSAHCCTWICAHCSHLPPATFCKSNVYHVSASVGML